MGTIDELNKRKQAYQTIQKKYGISSQEMRYAVYLDTKELLEFCEIVTGKKIK